ncbi:FMN-linked oxidoreductase [Backusella circina FSU 941]|nr:FMN-linked oxidoreductase [Backusella circina FSU 941]
MSLPALFTPVKLGAKELKHRVVLAPLTRMRSTTETNLPTDLMTEYYSQRATDGGLLISEGTIISENAGTYPSIPNIFTEQQIEGWKRVTDAVHAKGGIIYLQICHPGRAVSSVQRGGRPPLSSSGIPIKGVNMAGAPYEVPLVITIPEIRQVIQEFKQAALNAIKAGFDGVEIHSANGFLLDEFINSTSNKRTDSYGGSIENRARFALEVVDAIVESIGEERTAIRFSPFGNYQDMGDDTPYETWGHLVQMLQANHPHLSYLHFVDARGDLTSEKNNDTEYTLDPFRQQWKGAFVSAGAYTHDVPSAFDIAENKGDLIAFGRSFIANPDLVERLRHGWPLNKYDRNTFYTGGEVGYTDYPFYKEIKPKQFKSLVFIDLASALPLSEQSLAIIIIIYCQGWWVYSEIEDAVSMIEPRIEGKDISIGLEVGSCGFVRIRRAMTIAMEYICSHVLKLRWCFFCVFLIVTGTEEESQIRPKEMNQKRPGIAESNLFSGFCRKGGMSISLFVVSNPIVECATITVEPQFWINYYNKSGWMIKEVFKKNDVTNEITINYWRHIVIFDFQNETGLPLLEDDFSMLSLLAEETEAEEIVNEIHEGFSSFYSIISSFAFEENDIIREEYDLDQDVVNIITEGVQDYSDVPEGNLEEQNRSEQAKMRNSVDHLKNFIENMIINDDDDFKFHKACIGM